MKDGFLLMLMLTASMTTLITEALKKMLSDLHKSVPNNLLAGAVSIVTSGGISAGYIILNEVQLNAATGVHIAALILLSWLCAMLGYDKVKQTLTQIRG